MSSRENYSEDKFGKAIASLIEKEDFKNAMFLASEAVDKYPFSEDLFVQYCDTLLLNGKNDNALDIINKRRGYFTGSSDIELILCKILASKKQWKEARKHYDEFCGLDMYPDEACDYIHSVAQECIGKKNYREALYYLAESQRLMKEWNRKNNSIEENSNEVSLINDIAFCHDRLGDVKEALLYYKQCVDLSLFSDFAWFNLGTAYIRNKELKKGEDAYEYAIALNPKNSPAVFNLALMSFNSNKFEEAKKYFSDFCGLENNSVKGTIGLAHSYLGTDDIKEAEILYRKALMLDPGCKEAKESLDFIHSIDKNKSKKSRK